MSQWKNSFIALIKKRISIKIIEFSEENMFKISFEEFWYQVLKLLQSSNNSHFTLYFEDCEISSLLFISLFNFKSYDEYLLNSKKIQMIQFHPLRFDTTKVIAVFKDLYKCIKFKFHTQIHELTPMDHLIWLNDLELLQEVLKISSTKISSFYQKKKLFLQPLSLKMINYLKNDYILTVVDAGNLLQFGSTEVLQAHVEELDKSFLSTPKIQFYYIHDFIDNLEWFIKNSTLKPQIFRKIINQLFDLFYCYVHDKILERLVCLIIKMDTFGVLKLSDEIFFDNIFRSAQIELCIPNMFLKCGYSINENSSLMNIKKMFHIDCHRYSKQCVTFCNQAGYDVNHKFGDEKLTMLQLYINSTNVSIRKCQPYAYHYLSQLSKIIDDFKSVGGHFEDCWLEELRFTIQNISYYRIQFKEFEWLNLPPEPLCVIL
eukprot:gene6642-10807_t